MKQVRLTAAIVCLLISLRASSRAQDHGFGAGIIIGEPTGITVKGWLNPTNAIDGGLAWSFSRGTSLHLHADYLWHSFHVFETNEKLPLYYGIGMRIKTADHGDDSRLGVRMVVGVDYMFRDAPVDLFLEVAPILDLTPATELQMNAGLGARFWFQ